MSVELTVVVPTYNGARFLSATLDSLQRQSGADLEVIVVDDGSEDSSATIAESHPAVNRLVRQENLGVAAARNRGALAATGHFVAFVDQDDLWHPSRAATLLNLARETSSPAVGTSEFPFAIDSDRLALEAVGDGRHSWPQLWLEEGTETRTLLDLPVSALGGSSAVEELRVERFMSGPAAITTSFMYERELYAMAGGCAPWVKAADDHVLNVCVARLAGKVLRLDVPCLFYRVHPSSTSTVSPLVAAYLSMSLALRLGRSLPDSRHDSDYLRHLFSQMPDSGLRWSDQAALTWLSAPRHLRTKTLLRLAKGSLKRVVRRNDGGPGSQTNRLA